MTRRTAAIAFATVLLAGAAPASAAHVTLKESGSALIEPLFREWARDYAESDPDVAVMTAATGSRQGTLDAFSGAAQIGGSDTFLTDDEAETHPGFIDVAVATSAVVVAYNLPELRAPLKLDGPTLAAIFDGTIRSWDDKPIAELNPDLALPHHAVATVRLAKGAGETLLIEQYLASAPSWPEDGSGTTLDMPGDGGNGQPGLRTSIAWATLDGAREAGDNDAMVKALAATPYAIGYASFAYADRLARTKLGVAAMRSNSDEFLQPDVRTIAAAVASLTLRMPVDMRLTQVNAPGTGCYPLVNYEYAVVATTQDSAEKAAVLRDFLNWAISRDAASFARLAAAHLVGLPSSTWLKSLAQIDLIH